MGLVAHARYLDLPIPSPALPEKISQRFRLGGLPSPTPIPRQPRNVEIIFGCRIRRDTPGAFRTVIDRPVIGPATSGVVVNAFYKHSRIKQDRSLRQRRYG